MGIWIYYLMALTIHELYHLGIGRVLLKEGIRIHVFPGGYRAFWRNFQPEAWHQCIVCAAGPAGNILTALILWLVSSDGSFGKELIKANLFIGLFNLIPLYPMDGGNILLVILYHFGGSERAWVIMKKTGQGVFFFLLAAGVCVLLLSKNPSLLITVALLPGVKSIKKAVRRMNLSAFIRRRERILKKKAYPVRHILVLKEITLGEAMLLLDYDRFHIILVVDNTMEIKLQLTEKQLMDAMMCYDSGRTIESVFNLAGDKEERFKNHEITDKS